VKVIFAIKHLASAVGGAERVLCTVCSLLAKRGHDVTIVTFDKLGADPFYPLDSRVKKLDLGIGDSSSNARLGETLRRIHALRKVILEEQPQVAVGFMHSVYVPLAFALRGTSIPAVGSEHIAPEHYRTRRLQFALLVLASHFLARITVLSEVIRVRYPAPIKNRMVVMPNPVDMPLGQAALGVIKTRRVLLNVGRLEEQKDQRTLLQAFAYVSGSYPDWDLRIIGDGSLRNALETYVRDLGLEGRVFLPGVTADVGAEYRGADAFVISSHYEAFGLATAEAMSYGLPVLGFADCPGTNELIQHEQTGLLVPGGGDRSSCLARVLERLMSDDRLQQRLGTTARSYMKDNFSAARIGDFWEKLLADVTLTKRA
jgi:glycosyltransferase involved in cell wall biosynthesis